MSIIYLRFAACVGAFALGIWVGHDYTTAKYKADIADIERNHATDLAEQISMASDIMADSIRERDQREAAYREALEMLNERKQQRERELQSQIEQLNEMENTNEQVRNVGNIRTPDAVVEWLQ